MGSSLSPPSFQGLLIEKSQFLGQNQITLLPQRSTTSKHPKIAPIKPITAKFNIAELLGGRGLCNGEAGLKDELKKDTDNPPQASPEYQEKMVNSAATASKIEEIAENGFEKELLGLTGGFPGGEKGLKEFIEKNPPPKKEQKSEEMWLAPSSKKPKPPQLPLILPGMIVLVKNPKNPFYMYCGIVQRITDGKAGVIFEGGNWDRLVTFRLEELERREKGPPMVNPKSVILEPLIEKLEQESAA